MNGDGVEPGVLDNIDDPCYGLDGETIVSNIDQTDIAIYIDRLQLEVSTWATRAAAAMADRDELAHRIGKFEKFVTALKSRCYFHSGGSFPCYCSEINEALGLDK